MLLIYLSVQSTYQFIKLTPCSRALHEKLTVSRLVMKFPTRYGTITVFTLVPILSKIIQHKLPTHTPYFLKIHCNITLISTPRLINLLILLYIGICTYLFLRTYVLFCHREYSTPSQHCCWHSDKQ